MAIAETDLGAEQEADVWARLTPGTPITEEELMRLPKDGPGNPTGAKYELVDGRLTDVPTKFGHDEIGFNIILLIGPYTRGRGVCSTGQDGFRMADGNVRVPDVSYTRKGRIPGGRPGGGFGGVAPDLCVGIISPSDRPDDTARKVRDYFDSGATLVWHVLPEAGQVAVFTTPSQPQFLESEDVLTADDVLPGFSCRVADIFATE